MTRPARACGCRDKTRFRVRRGSSAIRWSSAIIGCGSGWATLRAPIPTRSPITTGSTIPTGAPRANISTVKGNWQLVVDNLLDLTHLAFVHGTTIGNPALVEQAQVKVQRSGDNNVTVTRWIVDAPAPPTFVKAGGFTSNVDRWQIINFTPPAFLRLDVGATPTGTGAPEGKRVGGIGMWNLNAITPETETTSHYFWGQAHNFDIHNPKTTDMLVEQIRTAFLEDVAVFEAQQRNLLMIPNPPQTDINADAGVIQARRILDRLYQEEQAANAKMAAAE